jgi:NAD(P) transhydrogenase subunit alpha
MAATNAISGISLVASLVLAGAHDGVLATVLGTIAVGCAMANVVGGFLITDRMLAMFKPAGASNKEGATVGADRK